MLRNDVNVTRMPERTAREVPVRGPGAVGGLRNEINHLFDRFAGRDREAPLMREPWDLLEWPLGRAAAFAQSDLSEKDDAYELQVDLPGLTKDDVAVDYANGVITISGERSDEHEDERKGYYVSERSYGAFKRSFRVPDDVQADDIDARFDHGVLTVKLPKSEEARRDHRKIEVQG
ncbi:MAG: Hsp20/alpha crystallin family protein [Halofilum sp. (in: g-proteobacteria)]|nr:Hsp20/alpha crystallin family protein [Halofilum sp. (in: g-proteobacteria)]